VPRPLLFFPPRDLRVRLEDARRRGLSFEDAWQEAMAGVRFPHGGGTTDVHGRYAWREALSETREAWRSAYEGEPAEPGVQALAALAGVLPSYSELPPIAA
jgi:hypothetical protein